MTITTATREGTDGDNADSARVYVSSGGVTAAAVIDGIGHTSATVALMPVLAEVVARTAAVKGGPAGLLTAGMLVADGGPEDDGPNAVGAVVTTSPSGRTVASWAGDCRVYGWDGTRLRRWTTDHTVGQQLRENGAPWELAEEHDNWLTVALSKATPATVYTVVIPDTEQLLLVTTDGVHDQTTHDELEEAIRQKRDGDLQTLADAIVVAAGTDPEGYRDDATVVVLDIRPAATG
ncbi:hypothetical protein AB0L68_36525 [Streptomyces sp. NPDC052164]|uniref:PP2C family protein-serine/threonine phosphatase n=1 Tax=Streptomyces sp. NPDC052164 TaxID=3155529 RepID=UPI003425DF27